MSQGSGRRYEEPWPVRHFWGRPMFWGMVMTLAVLLGAVLFGMQEDCGITGSCETRAVQLWAGAPHEIAGALGGVALVLIAVWLAVIAWVLSRMLARAGERSE